MRLRAADLKPGDEVIRQPGVTQFVATVVDVDRAKKVATLQFENGDTESKVPFSGLILKQKPTKVSNRTPEAVSKACLLLTRILVVLLIILWLAQTTYDLRNASFSVTDGRLFLRLIFVVGAFCFLLISKRVAVVANWFLLPLGLIINIKAPSTTSQGLALPSNWFDKLSPIGTQHKNPAVVEPDPSWNFVNKQQ